MARSDVRKFFDTFERTVWTVAEGAGAAGILAGYNALPLPDVPTGYWALTIVLLGGLLAAGKSVITQAVSETGSAATLPAHLENTKTEVVVVPTPLPVPTTEAPVVDPSPTNTENDEFDERQDTPDPEVLKADEPDRVSEETSGTDDPENS